jgi:hypothetical protein
MQFRKTELLLLLGAMALPASGVAQTTPVPLAITRTVVAATKLSTVTDAPLHFKAVNITLQPDEKSGVSAANGILYQVSGIDRGLARWRGQNAQRWTGAVHRRRKDRGANGGRRSAVNFSPLLPCPGCGLGAACRDGTRRRARIISHCDSDPRPEARRL